MYRMYPNPNSMDKSESEEENVSTSESNIVPTHSVTKTDNETETTDTQPVLIIKSARPAKIINHSKNSKHVCYDVLLGRENVRSGVKPIILILYKVMKVNMREYAPHLQ